MNTQTEDKAINAIEDQAWYQSTQGPKISATLKSVALLILPIVQELFPKTITTGIDDIDRIIDVGLIIGFGAYALYGYIRAKKTMLGRIDSLNGQIARLGGVSESSPE